MSRKNEIQIQLIALLGSVGLAALSGIVIGIVFRPQNGNGGMEISVPDAFIIPDSIATWQIALAFAGIALAFAGLGFARRRRARRKSEKNIQR